jgi:long-chain acyl-CoA synthetase
MGTDHLATMIRESVRVHAARPAMRWQAGGAWTSMTYAELGARIDAVAQGLLAAGVREGERVGICSRNVPAWTIADLAIQSVRAVTVPIYATNTAQQVEHVTRDAELALLFVGEQEQYDKVEAFRSCCRRVAVTRLTTGAKRKSEFISSAMPCAKRRLSPRRWRRSTARAR